MNSDSFGLHIWGAALAAILEVTALILSDDSLKSPQNNVSYEVPELRADLSGTNSPLVSTTLLSSFLQIPRTPLIDKRGATNPFWCSIFNFPLAADLKSEFKDVRLPGWTYLTYGSTGVRLSELFAGPARLLSGPNLVSYFVDGRREDVRP